MVGVHSPLNQQTSNQEADHRLARRLLRSFLPAPAFALRAGRGEPPVLAQALGCVPRAAGGPQVRGEGLRWPQSPWLTG